MKQYVAGVDEAGRGALAGPVLAAAVILDAGDGISGLADSKSLSAKKREHLAAVIRAQALSWSVARVGHKEIDSLNILQASLLAMQQAVAGLHIAPAHVQVDGNQLPKLPCSMEAIPKGDQRIAAISAASILAKVERDEVMTGLEADYPGYGFAQHKGYPTRQHLQSLKKLGACPVHRRSYAPVRRYL